jgi:hypothetical protein
MIAVTPTTGPLGPPPGAVMPDAHRHHVVDVERARATRPLAGAVAAIASLVGFTAPDGVPR